jgi:DNA-binding NtrC family response regulator
LSQLRDRYRFLQQETSLCSRTTFYASTCWPTACSQKPFAPDALSALEEHSWPSNVREFENLIQRLVITVSGSVIELKHLPQQSLAHSVTAHEAILIPPDGVRFDDEIRELEVALLEAALRRSDGSKAAAARLLHLDSQKMKYLGRRYSL